MAHIKDDPAIPGLPLAPPAPVAIPPGASALVKRLANTYNRIGGLLKHLATAQNMPVGGALAVWQVESGGADFVVDHAILRFENHKFFQHWGQHNQADFDAHFRFGGRAGVGGQPWTNHKWRPGNGAFQIFHGDQSKEYAVFDFATNEGGKEAASLSSSFGGPQVLGSNFAILGYPNATALAQAFQESERWHVCGFYDFCVGANAIVRIRNKQWVQFARIYNGAGQADLYGGRIKDAFDASGALDL